MKNRSCTLMALLSVVISISDAWAQAAPAPAAAAAAFRVGSPFSDHMVLQRDMLAPVWGTAAPGSKVEVAFAGQSMSATADAKGKWMIKLGKLEASAESREMTVTCGADKTVFKDVVVGEVWFGSGQSNMQMGLDGTEGGAEAIANSTDPLLRSLVQSLDDTKTDVSRDFSKNKPNWELASPESVTEKGRDPRTKPHWSAVAYYMARKLRAELKVPVGIISSSCGSTPAQVWIAPEGADFEPETEGHEGTHEFYHNMIHPLIPYGIRGVIWYQGENNIRLQYETFRYKARFKALVGGWRKAWGQGDFPFYAIQLGYCSWFPDNSLSTWCEGMNQAVKELPHTGVIVNNDLNPDYNNVHPVKKREAGERCALLALGTIHGVKMKAHASPEYQSKSMTVEGSSIKLKFDQVGDGLKSRDGKPLTGFEITDGSKAKDEKGKSQVVWVPATATAKGNTVTLTSDKVAKPTEARYAWIYNTANNVVNSEGLPLGAFRTHRPDMSYSVNPTDWQPLLDGFKSTINPVYKQVYNGAPGEMALLVLPTAAAEKEASITHTFGTQSFDITAVQITSPHFTKLKVQVCERDTWKTVAEYKQGDALTTLGKPYKVNQVRFLVPAEVMATFKADDRVTLKLTFTQPDGKTLGYANKKSFSYPATMN